MRVTHLALVLALFCCIAFCSAGALTVAQLRKIMPNVSTSKANAYISHLNNAMNWGAINTCKRKTAFLAQLAHESGELRYMEEIASGAAYEGRKDLGNTHKGDGKRYKGRGPIQLTGRANYRAAGKALGYDFEAHPTVVATPKWGFKVAAWFWKTRGLNKYADSKSFDTITRRINGGLNGKADRDSHYRKAKSVLGC
jgi:predicted chitinase